MFKHVSWKLIGILVAGTVVVGAAAVYWDSEPRRATALRDDGELLAHQERFCVGLLVVHRGRPRRTGLVEYAFLGA